MNVGKINFSVNTNLIIVENIFCPWLNKFLNESYKTYWERLKIDPTNEDFGKFAQKHLTKFFTDPWDITDVFHQILVPVVAQYLNDQEKIFIENYNLDFSSYEETCKSIEIIEQLSCDSYVIESFQAQGKAWKALLNAKKLDKDFPFLEMYRFAIDGNKQWKGKYIFEDEPGYIVGVFNAIVWSFDSNKSIDGDWFINLHKIGMTEVLRKIEDNFIHTFSELGTKSCYGIGNRDQDCYGKQDILNRGTLISMSNNRSIKLLGSESFLICQRKDTIFEKSLIWICPSMVEKRKAKLNFLFQCLNVFLDRHKGEKNSGLRLLGILWLARHVVTDHFFPDGNGRSAHMIPNAFIARDEDLGAFMLPHDPNFYVANGPEKILFRSILASQNFINKGKNVYWEKRSNENCLLSSLQKIKLDKSLHSLVDQSINLIQMHGSSWAAYHILFMSYNRINIPKIVENENEITQECKELLSVVNEKTDYSENIVRAIINIGHAIEKNESRLEKLKKLLSDEKSLITLLEISEQNIQDNLLESVLSSEQN